MFSLSTRTASTSPSLQSCFPVCWPIVCTRTCCNSFPGKGSGISLCWTSWHFCQSTSPACQMPFGWVPIRCITCSSYFCIIYKVLRLHSVPSSRIIYEVTCSIDPNINPSIDPRSKPWVADHQMDFVLLIKTSEPSTPTSFQSNSIPHCLMCISLVCL